MRCAIWYRLHILKKVKNTHEEVLLLVKLQAEAKWYQIAQRMPLFKWYDDLLDLDLSDK